MDSVDNWKRILLQWVKECNFLESSFYNIEQSEIEAFFVKFRNHVKDNNCQNMDLSSFLKEHYPLFEPHFDDENGLSAGDYIYVYSLLLHFSCVKCPVEFFQKNCQQMNEAAQQNITTFFKKLLEDSFITKESLRHAIASISLSPPPNTRLIRLESPMKTPRRSEISPPTPRSCILQERNKELYNIKVQLENEAYEKGVLEIEVKQNQEKILKLSRELKRSHQEIQNLKNEILLGNTESGSDFKHSAEEQVNRRLCKQISQKEVEIEKQRKDIDELSEQKDFLTEKLIHAERQMKIFQNKIEELALKVDELTEELQQKDFAVQYLTESKQELEHYITEIRSSSASSRPDLNISVEYLDLSRTTNSSGSITSPENLGCSVVDIQLREKENENLQLREEISAIRLDNAKLAKHMSDLTVRYSKFFDICNENLIIDQKNVDPIENFIVFSNYVEKFVEKYEENCIALNELRENEKIIEEQNHALSCKVAELESEAVVTRKKINDLQNSNNSLEVSKTSLENSISECEKKLEISLKERLEIVHNLESIKKELESLRIVKNHTEDAYEKQIEDLKTTVEISREKFLKLKTDFENKDATLKSLEADVIENKMKNQQLISQIEQLNMSCENEKTSMKNQYDLDMHLLNEKLEQSSKAQFENETKCQQYEAVKEEYENKIVNYVELEKKLSEKINLGEAQLEKRNKLIDELKEEKKMLTKELEKAKQDYDSVWNEKLRRLKENEDQISALKLSLEENRQIIQRLTDDQNQQYLKISELQVDKEALINSVQEKIEVLRNLVDKHDNSFKEIVRQHCDQHAEVKNRLDDTEAERNTYKTELDHISSRYNNIEEILAERTKHFSNVVDELRTKLELIFEQMDIKATENNLGEKSLIFSISADSTDNLNNLKQCLNALIHKLQQITSVNIKNEKNIASLSERIQKLVHEKSDLEHKLILSERQICELREDLESELQCETNKLTNEVKRLNEDICNLENVCEHLSEENTTLQAKLSELEKTGEKLTQENRLLKEKTTVLEADRLNQLSMADKLRGTETELRAQVMNMQSSVKELEMDIEAVKKLLLDKTRDAELLLDERNEAESNIESMREQISELQSKILVLEFDLKTISEKYEAANKCLEENTKEHCKELETLRVELDAGVTEKHKLQKELDTAEKHLNELKNLNVVLENRCQLVDIQLEEIKSNLISTKPELIRLQCEETRLLGELALIKETKVAIESQVEKSNKEIVEQKENVSRLIKEVAAIRREKDALEEEKRDLLKRFQEKVSTHSSLDTNHKLTAEKLQLAERELLAKQNLLKSEQLKSQDLENQLNRVQMENIKLRETGENYVKRMEKQALKLGETQAKSLRLKKDLEVAQSNVEALNSSTEATQRENIKLNLENKSLKEKLCKCEKTYDQLESKLQTLEKANEALRVEKESLETSEQELKSTNAILKKNKASLEDKVRKLAKSLTDLNTVISHLEQNKVQLNLEVGGLNTQLQESKTSLTMKLKEIQDVKNANLKLIELNEKLQVEANEIREEHSNLIDQLSKVSLHLKIAQEGHESMKTELETLRADLDIKKEEKDVIEKEHLKTTERLKQIEVLVDARHSTESELVDKIKSLETELGRISSELFNLEETRKQEQLVNEKLNKDISILQAKLQKSRLICEENEMKWNEEKEKLLIEVKASDERIKETRLELEGKLEKMKNKMKTLYNDEIAKTKKKQEREMAVMESEIDALKAQNTKYEEHIKKLSSQVFKLNENILEHQKQNTFLQTKLKDCEFKQRQFNPIKTTHVTQSSAQQALSSNLHMEDEEGEVFNNTYLSDLKNGRMPEMFSRDVCPQELQYRNSLLPPHLKSTYLAQFDHQMGEDEIRETPNFDDSLSTLLNTGQRKKVSGATSYKRPGPPTPSKNAGRLSFGGTGELSREILKEAIDAGNGPTSSKTPIFKFFSSRHSMKDENTPPNKRRLSNLFKKK